MLQQPDDLVSARISTETARCANPNCAVTFVRFSYNPPTPSHERILACPACGFPLELRGRIYVRPTRVPPHDAESRPTREQLLRALDALADEPHPARAARVRALIEASPDIALARQAARVLRLFEALGDKLI